MSDIRVRQGSRVPLFVTQGDEGAVSATLILRNQDTLDLIEINGDYEEVDGEMVADLTIESEDTMVLGLYDIQVNENFDLEDDLKYPDPDCEDCEFPTLEICEALDVEGGSS